MRPAPRNGPDYQRKYTKTTLQPGMMKKIAKHSPEEEGSSTFYRETENIERGMFGETRRYADIQMIGRPDAVNVSKSAAAVENHQSL